MSHRHPLRASLLAIAQILIVLAASAAHAQWSEDGRLVEDDAWRRSNGDFGAMVLVTDDIEGFHAAWSKPAAPGYQPNISTVNGAHRGDTVTAILLFFGCRPIGGGHCDTSADFRVIRPDGSFYAEYLAAPIWDAAPPPEKNLMLGLTQLAFEVEPGDPLGVYRIEVDIHDRGSDAAFKLVRRLEIKPTKPVPATPSPARPAAR